MKRNYPLSRKSNVVVQELDGEVLIYDLNNNKAFCLNETSALVWQMCDGSKSITEISESVGKKFDTSANEDLVWLALDQLKKERLIENGAELENPFQGMNRREVIKKVGLGTMIALPIISALIVPTGAAAASCTAQQSNCSFFPATVCCPGNSCKGGATPTCCSNTSNGLIKNGSSAGSIGGADAVSCRGPLQDRCCSGIISNASYTFGPPSNPTFTCSGTCAAAP